MPIYFSGFSGFLEHQGDEDIFSAGFPFSRCYRLYLHMCPETPEIQTVCLRSGVSKKGLLRGIAEEVSYLLDILGPHILKYTERICPLCEDVCCIDHHSQYAYDDFVYFSALEERMVERKPGLDDRGPCQFLGPNGCKIRHSRRPYRCTWYFCSPLLREIEKGPAREYRKFLGLLCEITEKRTFLLREFQSTCEGVRLNHGTSPFPVSPSSELK